MYHPAAAAWHGPFSGSLLSYGKNILRYEVYPSPNWLIPMHLCLPDGGVALSGIQMCLQWPFCQGLVPSLLVLFKGHGFRHVCK